MKGFSDRNRKPGSANKAANLIRDHLDQAFTLVLDMPPRKRSLRCSGLPYCPILDVLTPPEPEIGNLDGTLFTAMGTAAHEAIQLFMTMSPMGADVWGSWGCSVCQKELPNQFRPRDCCGRPMIYKEVDLRVGPLTGHVDLITRYNKRWFPWEFKTIGPDPKKPKRQHFLQIRHYVAMLDLQHNIKATGYTVVYVLRQFLERRVFGPYEAKDSLQETKDWIFRAIRGFKAATKARKDASYDNIAAVVRERPCRSMGDWDDYMSRGYQFQKTTCPMLSACTRGDRACHKRIEDMLEGR